ncbi:MAG: hypothetical protein HY646_07700 [Acidobacteria bacterium]|nr:hypothetical protein [Acidobacteriota bacterium]
MNFIQKQLEDPIRFARVKRGFYIGLLIIALAEIILPIIFHSGETHFSFENFPAWGALYGLVSCAAIIIVSKLLGKLWLMRREDYYDAGEPADGRFKKAAEGGVPKGGRPVGPTLRK